jgi:hypothetical protein
MIWQYLFILGKAVIDENYNLNCNVLVKNVVEFGNIKYISLIQLWDGLNEKLIVRIF